MTELLEQTPNDAMPVAFDPEALIEEAREHQRRRRRALAAALVVAIIGSAAAYFSLRGGASTTAPPVRPAPAAPAHLDSLVILLRGFGTPQQAAIDSGPCPQGRTLIAIASHDGRSLGWETECVLKIRKVDTPGYGIRSIHESVRATYPLPGGIVTTRESRRIRFARDQSHTHVTFTGTITGGTGRYAHAHGTLRGGGPGTNGRANWKIRFQFSSQ